MEKLYYKDPYLKEAETTVLSVSENDTNTLVTLKEDLFYPEGGGQCGDKGFLNSFKVLDTKKGPDGESVLYLEKEAGNGISVNDTVVQKLDWEHRYRFMKKHTAQHLLSGLLFNLFGIGTVAVHLGEQYLTIETDRERIDSETVHDLVLAANRAIWEAHRVRGIQMSHEEAEALNLRRSIKVEGQVRIVEIEGIDRIACGGVHVDKTSEIGLITAIGHEQIRGHERIYFNCSEKALEGALRAESQDAKLCALLSCKTEETVQKVASLQTELTKTKALLALSEIKNAETEFRENRGTGVVVLETKLPVERFRGLGEKEEDICLCAMNSEGEKCSWIIILKGKYSMDMKAFLSRCGARGGGRAPVYQGMIEKDKKDEMKRLFMEDMQKMNILS